MTRVASKELSLKQNILWNSVGSIINLGCQWAMSIVIVRLSRGYDAAGVFALASSVYGMFSPIGQYRMKTYQVSDVRHENTTGEYLAFRIITCSIALVLCTGYSLLTCSTDAWLAILLYGVWKSISLIIEVLHACDQIHRRMDYIGQSLAMQGIGNLFIFGAVFYLSNSLEMTLLSMALFTSSILLILDRPRTSRFDNLHPRISSKKVRSLLLRCSSIVVAGIAASAASSLPRQLLASIEGASALGIYVSIASPIAIIQMGASYIYGPLLTTFSEHYFHRRRTHFYALFLKVTLAIAIVGACATLAIVLVGESLLVLLYGEGIRSYTYLMIPMVPFAACTGFMWFMNDLLISVREFRGSALGGAVSLITALVVMGPIIHAFNMNGVTITGLLSCLISLIIMGAFLVARVRSSFSEE